MSRFADRLSEHVISRAIEHSQQNEAGYIPCYSFFMLLISVCILATVNPLLKLLVSWLLLPVWFLRTL